MHAQCQTSSTRATWSWTTLTLSCRTWTRCKQDLFCPEPYNKNNIIIDSITGSIIWVCPKLNSKRACTSLRQIQYSTIHEPKRESGTLWIQNIGKCEKTKWFQTPKIRKDGYIWQKQKVIPPARLLSVASKGVPLVINFGFKNSFFLSDFACLKKEINWFSNRPGSCTWPPFMANLARWKFILNLLLNHAGIDNFWICEFASKPKLKKYILYSLNNQKAFSCRLKQIHAR